MGIDRYLSIPGVQQRKTKANLQSELSKKLQKGQGKK